MQNDEKVKFLPFNAINEFMKPEFRECVIRTTLNSLPDLPALFSRNINNQIKKTINIPGFRNSAKAPNAIKIKPTENAFEKHPELVAAILSAWAESHSSLKSKIYNLLVTRGWEVLPIDADRTRLPGFLVVWPKNEDFNKLKQSFDEMYPNTQAEQDDVSLMIVWLGGKLPYNFSEND